MYGIESAKNLNGNTNSQCNKYKKCLDKFNAFDTLQHIRSCSTFNKTCMVHVYVDTCNTKSQTFLVISINIFACIVQVESQAHCGNLKG